MPPTQDWTVHFQDESREIASEYKGGLGRYTALEQEALAEEDDEIKADLATRMMGAPTMAHQPLPPIQSLPVDSNSHYSDTAHSVSDTTRESHHHHSHSSTNSTYSTQTLAAPSQTSYNGSDQILQPQNETRDYLNSAEEVLFMQVFVEEVGLWMDSMDPQKHVCIVLDSS